MDRILKSIKHNGYLALAGHVCRFVLAVVFFYSGYAKLGQSQDFAEIIGAYGLLPDPLVLPMALVLPPLEIIAAIGILLQVRIALWCISSLVILFIGVLSYGIWLGLDIDCGCFDIGSMEHQVFPGLQGALYRDVLMLFPLGLCWYQEYQRRKVVINSVG
jgi:uncharacterized membrane protein YphA (DoxX/SURF4 family)